MARPARPERSRSARSSHQLSRFYHSINLDRVFGTHNHPGSDVKAIIVLEQINPPITYAVPCEHILAIHKATGYGPPATIGGTVRSDKMVPIGDGIVPQLGGIAMSELQLI